jgi:GDP-L-fucose synthase
VDDLATACFHLLGLADPPDWVNVGVGDDVTILDLATLVAKTVGYQGRIETDPSKPDGTPRKLMDVSKLKSTGWSPAISLETGLAGAYQDFLSSLESGAARL